MSRICALKNYNVQEKGTFIELQGVARYTDGITVVLTRVY